MAEEIKESNNETIKDTSESVLESSKAEAVEASGQENQTTGGGRKAEEPNWKLLRERTERAERERDELVRKLNAQQEEQLRSDDLVEGRHLQQTKQEANQRFAMLEAKLAEQEILNKFSDFTDVVNNETVEKLKANEPELYATLATNNDFYSKAIATYKTIKAVGLAKPSHSKEKEQIDKNSQKPVPSSSISPSQSSNPLDLAHSYSQSLSPQRKKEIWEQTKAILKGY